MKRILVIAAILVTAVSWARVRPSWQTWERGPQWLDTAIIYQIYPSSFQDSDGNGIGDIPGITSRLDYVASLDVDAIWLSPVFVSTWLDGGYDVVDFYKVDPRFGTNEDLAALVTAAHERGLRVLLDLVAGHTSYKHPWFLESAQGEGLPHSDYFIWTDTLPDASAREKLAQMLSSEDPLKDTRGSWMLSDSPRARYYNKNFYATQPALNYGYAHPDPSHPWEQPFSAPGPQAVRQEIRNIMSFWFDMGVDGFRVDMAASLVKDDDAEFTYAKEFWREIRAWMDQNYPDRIIMAEWGGPKNCLAAGFHVDMDLTGRGSKTHAIYQDEYSQTDHNAYFSLAGAENAQDILYAWMDRCNDEFKYTKDMGAFATITGNHDQFRLNVGDRNTPEQLKVMLSFVLTMPLPIIYYGEEIGMRSESGLPSVEGSNHNGHERSGARTPMQWDTTANCGFSKAAAEKLYLPVSPQWGCVASQQEDPQSLLNFTRALIALRRAHCEFGSRADWIPVQTPGTPYPMAYIRSIGDHRSLVLLNPTGKAVSVVLGGLRAHRSLFQEGQARWRNCGGRLRIKMGGTSVLILEID